MSKRDNCKIIDTSMLSLKEVEKKAIKYIYEVLNSP